MSEDPALQDPALGFGRCRQVIREELRLRPMPPPHQRLPGGQVASSTPGRERKGTATGLPEGETNVTMC